MIRKRFSPRSLRRRLLILITVVTLIATGISAAFSYRQARHDVQEMMDAAMAETASLLLALATQIPAHLVELPDLLNTLQGLQDSNTGLDMEFQIGHADGTLIARSPGAPDTPMSTHLGFVDIAVRDAEWRSLTLATESGDLYIRMFQSQDQRNMEALEIATETILPLGLSLPLLLLLIYLSVQRGLRPLDTLAQEVGLRTPDNLRTIDTRTVPTETRPLVQSLNRLLGRLGQSLDNERRFTADAAHELRTPLAAIRVQAQVALASADPVQHRHALNQVVHGTERATHLVEQLLRLARLDPLASLPSSAPVDLAELVSLITQEMAAAAPERTADFALELPAVPIIVQGNQDLLEIALRNLIDNARRYTRPGNRITVFAGHLHRAPILGVRDTGPGVPAENLSRLIERFYRGSQSDKEGSGLGLAIVRRIAELHDARFEVSNLEGGGFEARLRWSPTPIA